MNYCFYSLEYFWYLRNCSDENMTCALPLQSIQVNNVLTYLKADLSRERKDLIFSMI